MGYFWFILILILSFMCIIATKLKQTKQIGGADDFDPYRYVRFSYLVDFLRVFWLTR
jgi:hypothetical protein